MVKRAAFYIDGFNLYHAVDALGEPFLKWCDLRKLGEIIIPSQTESLVSVVFCTAFYPRDQDKKWRHMQYIAANEARGVKCVMGHYVHEEMSCRGCERTWQKPTEKETDINLALSLYQDAVSDVFDVAYLVTADSDQAATARFLSENYPAKSLVTVAPPGRNFSVDISRYAQRRIALNRDHLDRCVLPKIIMGDKGVVAKRPKEYEPPDWWVHPDNRPSKK